MELMNVEFITLDLLGVECGQIVGEPKQKIENIQSYLQYEYIMNGILNHDSNCIFQLGCCYEYSSVFSIKDKTNRVLVIPSKIETAIFLYNVAYGFGSGDAANQLGMMYYHGVYFKVDHQKAKEMFHFAASKNILNSLYVMGVFSIQDKDYTSGYEYFLKAADLGHPLSSYNVALALHRGNIVWEKNNLQALYYAKTAHDQVPQDVDFKNLLNDIYNELL